MFYRGIRLRVSESWLVRFFKIRDLIWGKDLADGVYL